MNHKDLKDTETMKELRSIFNGEVGNIENIVFDFGSVLVNADTKKALERHPGIPNECIDEIYDLITKKLLYEKENLNLPWYDIDQAKEYFISIASDKIKDLVNPAFETFLSAMYKYDYVDSLLEALRNKGYKLYYLSNWDKYSYILEEEFFKPLIEKFDGGIISWQYHMEKPSYSIYRTLTDKYNLKPSSCLFFDDKEENIEAAKVCGWNAIVFDYKTTPYEILNIMNIPYDIDLDDTENKIPVIINGKLSFVSSNRIPAWYACDIRNPKFISVDMISKKLEDAIKRSISDSDFNYNKYTHKKYVFTFSKDKQAICLGIISIEANGYWKWDIQYPLKLNKDGLFTDDSAQKMNEWAMAACNPIVGITKPYVLKVHNDSGSLIDANRYALSTDLISDRYLVISEDAKLEICKFKDLKDSMIEMYEFVGDKRRIGKIEEAYKNGKTVDNTFFYTALTGKPMLAEDQIDFDKSFKKIDFGAIKEKHLTEMATIYTGLMEAAGFSTVSLDAVAENSIVSLIGNRSDIALKEDMDGYFLYNKIKKTRSASVDKQCNITEQILLSVL